jgi:nicotinamide-nucleotide amidase
LAELIRDWESNLPECVKLAYLPRPGIVRLRLTVTGNCARDSKQILEVIESKLLDVIGQHVFGYDDISLEQVLGELLKEQKLTLGTAESCTGGNIARLITSVPGSSAYFNGTVIAYQNRIKSELLNVDQALINKHGAVSKAVVEQMAKGVQKQMHTDTAIATSGVAGPDGGTKDKPVGTTWISVVYKEKMITKKFLFWGTRERVIDQASFAAMQLLRQLILGMI